jgi:hypothetical protein
MSKLDGHCLCGATTYTCDAEPLFTGICHCTYCQHQTGSAYSIVVAVPKDALIINSEQLGSFTTISEESGQPAQRQFCSGCGSPIATVPEDLPFAVIKAGTLNDTSWLNPTVEVWSHSAQPFVSVGEGGRQVFEHGPRQ